VSEILRLSGVPTIEFRASIVLGSSSLLSLRLGLVTPPYARIGTKLMESTENPTIVQDDLALAAFPNRPLGMLAAGGAAPSNEKQESAETRAYDAFSSSEGERRRGTVRFRNRLLDSRPAASMCSRRRRSR
jgi:hypothetical protein